MQGMVDLADVNWDAKRMILSGTATVTGGEPFTIVLANNGHAVGKLTAEGMQGSVTKAGAETTAATIISAENAEVKWQVTWSAKAGQ